MYKSPIEIIYGQTQTQIEGDIFRAIQSYGINVDKEELLRALQYDRNQYYAGYRDAISDHSLVNVVRCKDCKHYVLHALACRHENFNGIINMNGFCSYGERREE